MKSVLLVGGSGFLGLHLVEQFWQVEPRPKIHVFDVRALPDIARESEVYTFDVDAIHQHIGDLTSEEDVSKALKEAKPDIVVHSASPIHGMGAEIYKKVNVEGTRVLLKCCQASKVKALVYTSSAGVVFNGEDLFGVDESWPFPDNAMDAYNLTKQQAEVMVLEADQVGGLRTLAIRPAGIFGPGDRQMIPSLRVMAERGQHRIQLGDNLNLFDVTYVGNVAWAHVLAASKLEAGEPVAGQAYFITNDAPIYFWSLAKQIWKHDGYVIPRQITIPKTLGVCLGYLSQWGCALVGKEPSFTAFRVRTACATRYYDISKAKRLLDYTPKWSLEEAIAVTLEHA